MKKFKGERGAVSLIGLLALSILSFLGMAAFTITYKEIETTRRFLNAAGLQMEAQNGILTASEYVAQDPALRDKIRRASGSVEIFTLNDPEGIISCNIYAKMKNEYIILLAVSQKPSGRSRAIAYLKQQDGRFVIHHWEH